MSAIDARLKALGITLTPPPKPVASYVPFTRSGNLVFISGQVTLGPKGLEYVGIVGKDFTTAEGQAAARLCAVNVIAQLKGALEGDLDRVTRCVKVTGFVNAVQGYAEHPEVINGASNLFGDVFGEAGRHARAAVGAGGDPMGAATAGPAAPAASEADAAAEGSPGPVNTAPDPRTPLPPASEPASDRSPSGDAPSGNRAPRDPTGADTTKPARADG